MVVFRPYSQKFLTNGIFQHSGQKRCTITENLHHHLGEQQQAGRLCTGLKK
jgi:hypothetical protein